MAYDSIIPWSGGVESTAVVWWAINNGHKPILFHTNTHFSRSTYGPEKTAIDKMKKIMDVECINVWNTMDGEFPTLGGRPHPSWVDWMHWALIIQMRNPHIKAVWHGNNEGMFEIGDGLGDRDSPGFQATINGFREIARGLSMNFDVYCPIKASKKELWHSLPKEIQDLVVSSDTLEGWRTIYDETYNI